MCGRESKTFSNTHKRETREIIQLVTHDQRTIWSYLQSLDNWFLWWVGSCMPAFTRAQPASAESALPSWKGKMKFQSIRCKSPACSWCSCPKIKHCLHCFSHCHHSQSADLLEVCLVTQRINWSRSLSSLQLSALEWNLVLKDEWNIHP